MIRGAEQAFKFTTAFNFDDICNIEAVWSQPNNNGTPEAPMPIVKYYNKNTIEPTTVTIRNDGFAPVAGDPKSFVTMLSVEETMRFSEKYKGKVQATVYCDKVNRTDKSKIEYFTVYPTITNEIVSDAVRILDAGDIIASGEGAIRALDAGDII